MLKMIKEKVQADIMKMIISLKKYDVTDLPSSKNGSI